MQVTLPLAVIIVTLNLCHARFYVETLTVGNGARWGDWKDAAFCPEGHFAMGYNMKIEEKQGRSKDDTSMNGIRLLCGPGRGNGGLGGHIASGESSWGNWSGSDTQCSAGYFLVGFILQVEEYQGRFRDDTAANYIRFECRLKGDYTDHYTLNNTMGSGYWGSEGAWSNKCANGTAICGIQTKIESPQGRYKDDTALNDVKFFCCSF